MTYVRRVIPQDLRELIEMSQGFHAESPVFSQMPFDAARVQQLVQGAINDPDWLALVAVDDSGLSGMALFFAAETFFGPGRECMDLAFYVRPACRGTRAAQMMLDRVIQWATERGAARLTIAPRTGINDKVVGRFFERSGLEYAGTMWTTALPF